MKSACVLVVLVVFLFSASAASAQLREAVRPLDTSAQDAYDLGRTSSELFRTLVDELNTSDVIVHVVTGDILAFGAAGTTRLAGASGQHRYLRVMLRPHLPLDERTAVLGHELRHACEIAGSTAHTQDALKLLYDDIGRPVPGVTNGFETREASEAGMRVWRDLRAAEKLARSTIAGGRRTGIPEE